MLIRSSNALNGHVCENLAGKNFSECEDSKPPAEYPELGTEEGLVLATEPKQETIFTKDNNHKTRTNQGKTEPDKNHFDEQTWRELDFKQAIKKRYVKPSVDL